VVRYGPNDASKFVGEGNDGSVVTSQPFNFECPRAQSVGLRDTLGRAEKCAGSVDDQHSDIGVAALADRTEPSRRAAGSFARRQPQIAGEVSTCWKTLDIPNKNRPVQLR
jgi:hypothetical protein